MKRSARSVLVTGVIVLAVSAVAIAPVRPASPPAPAPTVRVVPGAAQLTAQVQPMVGANAVSPADFLALIVQHYVVPPSASSPFPTPQFAPVVGGTSIGSSIKNIYNYVEPWVEWGFDVAAYAVGWIPYVGWLAPQIEIFYNFGERIVRSITFNIADWLDNRISFGQGLINVGVDTVNAFIQLGIDQWNFWLWPLPPLPPIFPLAVEPETADLTIAVSIEDSLEPLSLEAETTEEDEVVDEVQGEQVESLGEELTQEEGAAEEKGMSELGSEFVGQLVKDEEEQIEGVVTTEETDVDLTVDGLTDKPEPKGGDEPKTADTSRTVQAQGEIRESAVAAPTPTSHEQSTGASPADDPNEEPIELARATSPQSPSTPQAPSTNADGPHNTADSNSGDGGAGTE